MKFTAVVPVTKMETRTYDIYVPEDVQKVIKAYEKWYDDMSKENETNLINAIKVAELSHLGLCFARPATKFIRCQVLIL